MEVIKRKKMRRGKKKQKEGRKKGVEGGKTTRRKEGWKEQRKEREETVGRRRREAEKWGQSWDAGQDLPLCFWIFHFYTCSLSISKIALGALQATQHLVPGLSVHLHKAVCAPLPMPICLTGQHPPSPASTVPPILASQPQEGCISWPSTQSSGGHLGISLRHHWPSSRSCSGKPSSLICAKASHDPLSPPTSWAAHQGIRAPRFHGVRAEECLWGSWHTARPPSLPTPWGMAIISPPPVFSTHPPGPRHSIQSVPRWQEGCSLNLPWQVHGSLW